MHPLFLSTKNLIAVNGLWLLISALLSLFFQSHSPNQINTAQVFSFFAPWFFCLLFFCASNFYVCQSCLPTQTSVGVFVAVQSGSLIVSILAWFFLGYLWSGVLKSLGQLDTYIIVEQHYLQLSLIAAFLYCIWVLSHCVYLMALEQDKLAQQTLQKQLLISQIELQAIKASTHPHFLYNALNTLANLTIDNPNLAHKLCLSISEFLRYSVNFSKRKTVSFKDELEHAKNYLTIEQERFGARLKLDWNVEDGAQEAQLLPLILFPLVENAVKHGVANLIDGGHIVISAKCVDDELEISVGNDFDPQAKKRKGTGLGLSSIKRRIQEAYGKSARLELSSPKDQWFEVKLRLAKNLPTNLEREGRDSD